MSYAATISFVSICRILPRVKILLLVFNPLGPSGHGEESTPFGPEANDEDPYGWEPPSRSRGKSRFKLYGLRTEHLLHNAVRHGVLDGSDNLLTVH
jgi:hypothetical protein